MKLKLFLPIFLSNLLVFCGINTFACGYYENPQESQMMMFRAQLPNMQALQPFYYTLDLYYTQNSDIQENDRFWNCTEWQRQTDESVTKDDIYAILYATNPHEFIQAYKNRELSDFYPRNTFIKQLSLPENKALMEYLAFSKRVEITEKAVLSNRFEQWDDESVEYEFDNSLSSSFLSAKRKCYSEAAGCLKKASTPFLKERYAYQVCRLGYQTGKYQEVIETYDTYFKTPNNKSLMNVWSLLFKAQCVDALQEKQSANVLYAFVFDNCDEKKYRCLQMLNADEAVPDDLDNHRQSVLYAMQMLHYPGRALDSLQIIYRLDKQLKYLPFLVMREINKLEDWILTPEYYRSFYENYYCEEKTKMQEEDNQATENRLADLEYIKKVKEFVVVLQHNTSVKEEKDFYSLALAHLSLMEENDQEAKKYLSAVSKDATPTVLLQKELEEAWLAVNTQDITKESFKDYFIKQIDALQHIKVENFDNNKMLYSLTLKLSKEYLKKNDRVTADLLRMKSEGFRLYSSDYENDYFYDYYHYIQLFDQNATVSDIDRLIALLQNTKKTPFEGFLCDQPPGSVDAYKDLKGTIAFRENDLQTAYEAFASLPSDFWDKTYCFQSYLNEDPFLPKGLGKKRDFSYRFNKADFVKTLIDLEALAEKDKKVQAGNYLKLGNAFYNCSYWGNAWMMANYGQSAIEIDYAPPAECDAPWKQKNYYTCDIASAYFQKALQADADNEQKAFATLMLYHCNLMKYSYKEANAKAKEAGKLEEEARKYAAAFYSIYADTRAFKDFQCPVIKQFLARK